MGVAALAVTATITARAAAEAPRVGPTAAPAAPTSAVGAEPGPYATTSGDYALPDIRVAGYPEKVQMVGHYVAPVGAEGGRPFALFLHGKHGSCFVPGDDESMSAAWPCTGAEQPVPNNLGYRYLQRLLASRGYVTVSIAANGIDGQDDRSDDFGVSARSALVRRHLALWDSWTSGARPGPDGRDWSDRVDLDRTLLVGHSRGGEGVVRAAVDTAPLSPWRVRGLVLLAPHDTARQVAPRVPTAVLMGYCDGELNFWPGQGYLDVARDLVPDPALRSAVSVMGANHGWFNTEWTPGLSTAPSGDDGLFFGESNALCGKQAATRLTAAEQRGVAKAYVAAASEVFLEGDAAQLSLFDGRLVDPERVAGAGVQVTPLGGHRVLVRPKYDATVIHSADATATLCAGYVGDDQPSSCGRGVVMERAPHWVASYNSRAVPTSPAAEIRWTAPGATAGLALREPVDLGASSHLDARVIVDPAAGPVQLAVRLTDTDGDRVTLPPRGAGWLQPMPGPGRLLRRLWAQQLRTDLSGLADAGVDRSAIARVELVSRNGSGRVWLLDASGWRRGVPDLGDTYVPRVNVHDAQAPEGGAGEHIIEVPVSVRGTLTTQAVINVQVVDANASTIPPPTKVVLQPGQEATAIPISYAGDGRREPDVHYTVNTWAKRGAVTGRHQSTAVVVDDD